MKRTDKIFLGQCKDIEKYYPGLSLRDDREYPYLKGILDVPNDNSEVIGSYLIEIRLCDGFPFRFPSLYEIGSTIPNEIDWHKYSDGRCCLTVLPDEILKCKAGINLVGFIKKYCVSFFANHIHKKETGKYLNGEYSHGYLDGIKEFYSSLFKTDNLESWEIYFNYVFKNIKMPYRRNDICFCKSGIKFKQCHLIIFSTLRDIGYERCFLDFLGLGINITK